MDLNGEIFVSGSKDNFVHIWKINDPDDPNKACLLKDINLHDRVWSVGLCEENKTNLAIGTAGISSKTNLQVFDLYK